MARRSAAGAGRYQRPDRETSCSFPPAALVHPRARSTAAEPNTTAGPAEPALLRLFQGQTDATSVLSGLVDRGQELERLQPFATVRLRLGLTPHDVDHVVVVARVT